MAWCALGDSAWLYEPAPGGGLDRREAVLRMMWMLERERIPEVSDIVVAYETLAVHFDPGDGEFVLDWLRELPRPEEFDEAGQGAPEIVTIPVAYGGEHGPDLNEVAERLGRSADEIVELHTSGLYQVAAIGFSPGFPYLTGLPDQLRINRKATPGPVPAGSVAIAGGQAGIYPFASPGGWWVLGRSATRLFDPAHESPSHLRTGNFVRFEPVASVSLAETDVPLATPQPSGGCEVIEAGGLCFVQDTGRPGFQHCGVSPGGAADPIAARVANLLVGNPEEAAVIESCLRGSKLLFHEDAWVSWVGWSDGGVPRLIRAGDVLDLTRPTSAARGYLAVAGGFVVPTLLGSRATDVRSGFGGLRGGALAEGDRLEIGEPSPGPAGGDWRVGWPRATRSGAPLELRVLPGMQAAWFADDAFATLLRETYQVGAMSDRMGTRLEGPGLTAGAREMTSQPVVAGSIQVPPDGGPIILLAERQTLGGYPQIAHVISADLPALGRAWPGTPLRFREVTLDEARQAWLDLQQELALLRVGLGLRPGR